MNVCSVGSVPCQASCRVEDSDGEDPAGHGANGRKLADTREILALERIRADTTGKQRRSAGMPGIMERFRREQLETLVVPRMGKEAALDQDDRLVG